VSEEATAPENSETGEETGTVVSESGGEKETAGGKWRVWYAPANLAVVTGQGKDEQEEGTDEDPASLFFEAETFEEIAQQYDSTEEYDLDTGHVQAIVFSDALLSDRRTDGRTVEVPGTGPCAWAQCLSVSRRKTRRYHGAERKTGGVRR